MIPLPENILELIKLWRRFGKDSIGYPVSKKSGAGLAESASQGEVQQAKSSLLYKFKVFSIREGPNGCSRTTSTNGIRK